MKSKFLVLCFVVFAVGSLSAQQLWQKIENNKNIQQKTVLYNTSVSDENAQLFSLEHKSFLELASKTFFSKKQTIQLPNETGELEEFFIVKTQNFEAELSAKFPNIQSFKAVKVDDQTVTASISFGTNGFNAVITSHNHEPVIISPYTKDKSIYAVYHKSEVLSDVKNFECNVVDSYAKKNQAQQFKVLNDGDLRTYRIAIVTSAEYSQFHLSQEGISDDASEEVKKETVLSAINTSLTRINEIYERELSVSLQLVANNDEIIFFDTATDGITNDDIEEMIDESQDICDREIGNNNYDIGHILGQGEDNGLAGLGVVCLTNQKAIGATSRNQPIGDSFDVDYFAHELGHQFGATHTQNNDCQRFSSTAVEPGSGSTIMSYAGICSPNVQLQVDDYFNIVNLDQMWSVIISSGTCATLSDTNNTAPIADAGANYTIPVGTPFVLSGVGTDVNDVATLTYSWEQTDNETATMPPVSTNTGGPTFRTLPAKSVSERYFPDLADIIAGNPPTWEVLPTVARTMDFEFTVRDNNTNGGAFASDDTTITVAGSEAFTVTSQNTSVTWDVGTTQNITWNVADTDQDPVNTQFVDVKLSTDGGITFPITLLENTDNDGSESFVVPNNVSENARIMVSAVDNVFFNVNDASITINSTLPTFVFTTENESVFACNVENETAVYNLNLDFVNDFSETVTFSVTGLPDQVTVAFSPESINTDGAVEMKLSNLNGLTSQNYQMVVTATSNTVTQTVDEELNITDEIADVVSLTSPENDASETSVATSFSWEKSDNASSYSIEIATDEDFTTIITQETSTLNTYIATNLQQGTMYFWRVKALNTCSESDFSEVFSFTTETCEVCVSVANTDFDTSTTFVSFNTISNATPDKTSGYSDFTDLNTIVYRDSIYELEVNANTADDSSGTYSTTTLVWVDWNQNCDFDDEGEMYNLGTTTSSVDGQTSLSPLEITVPTDAVFGNTIMRITTKFQGGGLPTSCENGADAEVEDYTIIVDDVASITNSNFKNLKIYPNPSDGLITVDFLTDSKENLIIQLLDLRGRVVGEEQFESFGDRFVRSINFSENTTGMYFVRIINGGKVSVERLIIR
ncbi:M12 family metallo-peptidase [Polaribacter sp.]|nr:M12 family metallo-peptidase [Polaribacter sp.]